jgi:Mn-dependent DtxR family transcriptional regulator
MKKEIVELLVDNTGVSTEQATIIARKIDRLYKQSHIDLLKEFIEHPTKPGYKRHDILDRIKKLENK